MPCPPLPASDSPACPLPAEPALRPPEPTSAPLAPGVPAEPFPPALGAAAPLPLMPDEVPAAPLLAPARPLAPARVMLPALPPFDSSSASSLSSPQPIANEAKAKNKETLVGSDRRIARCLDARALIVLRFPQKARWEKSKTRRLEVGRSPPVRPLASAGDDALPRPTRKKTACSESLRGAPTDLRVKDFPYRPSRNDACRSILPKEPGTVEHIAALTDSQSDAALGVRQERS